jgi:tetrahydromethanopterin S-methyltransferase subunit B
MSEPWYDNKALFEKIDALDTKIDSLRTDLEATRTLIRDYNNLRQKVEDTSSKVNTLMWVVPIMVAGIGVLFTVLNYLSR